MVFQRTGRSSLSGEDWKELRMENEEREKGLFKSCYELESLA